MREKGNACPQHHRQLEGVAPHHLRLSLSPLLSSLIQDLTFLSNGWKGKLKAGFREENIFEEEGGNSRKKTLEMEGGISSVMGHREF